jgi:uncharacterized protein
MRRISVRKSPIHGKGVFALRLIPAGFNLFEYTGKRFTPKQAAHIADDTYFFELDDLTIIDGARGGNSSRYLNHSCEPNCEFTEVNGRAFVRTMIAVVPNTELTVDYNLTGPRGATRCHCGAPTCRGRLGRH